MSSSRHRLKRTLRWRDLWIRDRHHHATAPLKMADPWTSVSVPNPSSIPIPATKGPDLTATISDELLLQVLSHLPDPSLTPASLVCKRWLRLAGGLRRKLTLLDWSFLPQLPSRFPDLSDLDLVPASFLPPDLASGVLLTRGDVSVPVPVGSDVGGCRFLDGDVVDKGVEKIAKAFPGLRRLSIAAVVSEDVVLKVAEKCPILQELELHQCMDLSLQPISAFGNLQILRLVGAVEGLYTGPGVTDIGLTILAHGCKRLVKLELSGCEGSYDGVSAIGRCCLMLEELTISDHRMDSGWMAGLSYCGNLKTLKLLGCKRIDLDPGPVEHLGSCRTIERLHLQRCQLRDKRSLNALFMICDAVRDVVFQDCWGLDNEMFAITSACRRVKFLSLEGCSQLTTDGLESVVLSWKELQHLSVVSCNNIKDSEVSPAMSYLFALLKELKWRPDSRSVLVASLKGTGMGKKGGKFFKRT